MTAPLVLLFGTIGNASIILVMCQKSSRRTAFGHYLMAIAVCDLIAIWVALVRHFVKSAFHVSALIIFSSWFLMPSIMRLTKFVRSHRVYM